MTQSTLSLQSGWFISLRGSRICGSDLCSSRLGREGIVCVGWGLGLGTTAKKKDYLVAGALEQAPGEPVLVLSSATELLCDPG